MHSVLVVPLIRNDKSTGAIVCCAKRQAAFSQDDERELILFASQAAVAIENARLFEEIKTNYLNTMKLLASVIDAKDTYTEDHSESVMRLALGVADILKVSDRTRSIVKYASLLHDIGKIGIDISILRKPAPLTKEEWSEMKTHPKSGADIIKKAGFLDDLVPAILYHHVKYSGGGYPVTKKRKNAIPVEARILAVADAYEAMTSDRPYRRHLSTEQAIAELKRCSGDQFDPKVVAALLKHLKP
jgi:putative nucleotidyltransferase with HDIG domain